jgi:hypothetical protein
VTGALTLGFCPETSPDILTPPGACDFPKPAVLGFPPIPLSCLREFALVYHTDPLPGLVVIDS